MLSLRRYRWLCVLGSEVAYILCLLGGFLPIRTSAGIELHHRIFETLPGFVWMHNTSLIKAEKENIVSAAPRKTA